MTKAVAAGPTVKTTVVRTTEEVPFDIQERAPEFWDYIESIRGDGWNDHILYIYRQDPPIVMPNGTREPSYLDKTANGMIVMPSGTAVPFSADSIKEKFGGRVFRFILKKGSERICEGKLAIEAPPRYPEMMPGANSPLPNAGYGQPGGDPTAQVANRAIDAMQNREPEAMRLAMDILSKSAEMLTRQNPPATKSGVQETLELIAALKQSGMIETPRAPEDPLSQLVKLKELKELFAPAAPTNSLQQTLEFITALKGSGLISVGGGRGGMWDLAGQVLPSVAGAAVEGIREWRMGMEAQSRAMIATRGGVQPNPPAQLPAAQTESSTEAQPAAPAAQAGQPDMSNAAPPLEWIETRIAAILKDLNSTVDEQVERVLDFLELSNPELIDGLLNPPSIHPSLPPGEKGILMLFQNRPILQKVPVNPRLTEFIKKFIIAAQAIERPAPGPQPVPSPQKPA